MDRYEDIFELFFTHLKHIAFPEKWLTLDMEMSKQEVFTVMMVDRLGEVTMSQISEQMNFPMSTATGIIDRLVKKRYVERHRSEIDRRIVTIVLADKGRTLIRQMKAEINEYIKRAYDVLDEEEIQCLFNIFSKIMTVFQRQGVVIGKIMPEGSKVKEIKIE